MYSLSMFGKMFMDRTRHDAYAEAMRRSIRPGDVVLDIGTGTGVYAMLACQLGARRVYALDVNPMIRVARDIALANGFDDRIQFIERLSTDVTLPEQADVIVADLRGVLPYYGQHLPSIIDAQHRHLKRGGTLIPRRDRLFAAIANNDTAAEDVFGHWRDNPIGLNMQAAANLAANTFRKDRVSSEQLLSEPQCVGTIDYWDLGDNHGLDATLAVSVAKAGTSHGVSLWFEATLADGIAYFTGPVDDPSIATIYGMAFLPFSEPIPVDADDQVSVRVRAILDTDDYVWSWSTTASDASGRVKAKFSQSSLQSAPLSGESIRRRAASFVVAPNEDLAVDAAILQQINDGASLGAVAEKMFSGFPGRFSDVSAALTRASELASKYVE